MGKANNEDGGGELPPFSEPAERALAGCAMVDAGATFEAAAAQKLTAAAFYDLRYRRVWEAAAALQEMQKPVEPLTVAEWLKARDLLESVGGLIGLAELHGAVVSAAQAPHYAEIVRDRWLRRKLLAAAVATERAARDLQQTGFAALEKASAHFLTMGEESLPVQERRLGEYIPDVERRIESFQRGKAQMLGVTSGFRYLDNMLSGFVPGDYYVLSARPSVGKTALALQFAEAAALAGWPALIFSMEMKGVALCERAWFGRSGASLQKYRNGFFVNEDVQRLAAEAPKLHEMAIWIDDTARQDMQQIAIKARRAKRERGCRFFVLDYIQLLGPAPGQHSENRARELAEISVQIKALARELDAPMLILAQMNRDFEKDPGRKPQLSDLKDCGQIEQDADAVMFLYDKHFKSGEADLNHKEMAWLKRLTDDPEVTANWRHHYRRINLLVAKQRNGPTGDCALVYEKSLVRFLDPFAV